MKVTIILAAGRAAVPSRVPGGRRVPLEMRATSWKTLLLLAGAAGLTACGSNDTSPTPAADAGRADTGVVAQDAPTVSDAGTALDAPPDAPAGPLPDLTIDQGTLQGNLQFATMYFPPGSCEIAEGCIAGPGWRRLLMFTTLTPNQGDADLNLGSSTTSNTNFEYSTCHMHYHFKGYADYSLLGADGGVVAVGHKQSFCVEDLERVDQTTGTGIRSSPHYRNCGEAGGQQGISRGWADDYYPNLPCQWIDVTNVPAGNYTVHVDLNTLNPMTGMHRFAESDYTNNSAEAMVTIPATWNTGSPLRACTSSDQQQGMGRDCGWRMEGTHTCTAGQHISVGCNALFHVGSCTGSWDVRVCRGSTPCNGGDMAAILGADSGYGSSGMYRLESTCGVAVFDCPAEGQYTVMYTSDYANDPSPGACTLETVIAGGDGGTASDGGSATDGGSAATDASTVSTDAH